MSLQDSIVLDHLDLMTDSTGLIQHAIYSVPRRDSGYTTDDNARALRLAVRLWQEDPSQRMLARIVTYLSFLEHARCPQRGFHNFMGYQRDWLDAGGTGDCQGQVVRALAEVLGSDLPRGYRELARELIFGVQPVLAGLRSLRAEAYVILAWGYLRSRAIHDLDTLDELAWSAAKRLVECYERSARLEWQWFESRLTYANAVLPQALFVAGQHWPEAEFHDVAEASFDFLDRATTADGVFWPVGNSDWYPHGEEKSLYDQQPVEAVTMVDAALTAYRITGAQKYLASLRRAKDWFYGRNSAAEPVADVETGACYDGLQRFGLNYNQGAESTLAYLWTVVHNLELETLLMNSSQSDVSDADSQYSILLR